MKILKTCSNSDTWGLSLSLQWSDGLQKYDISAHTGVTMSWCVKLGHMFDLPSFGPWLKVRLYVVIVVSLLTLTYRCESRNLTEEVMCKLNGCNSQMLSRITGNDVRTESRSATSIFDIVKHIRVYRLRWLDQIIIGNQQGRLLFKTMEDGGAVLHVEPTTSCRPPRSCQPIVWWSVLEIP